MLLSQLVYQVVKQAVYFEDNRQLDEMSIRKYANALTTNYGSDNGGISIDADYKRNLDNALLVINQALQRVASLNKLPLKTFFVDIDNADNEKGKFSINEDGLLKLNKDYFENENQDEDGFHCLDRIVNIFENKNANYVNIPYQSFSRYVVKLDYIPKKFYIEYYPEIKYFDFEDIAYNSEVKEDEVDSMAITDNNVDLRELGFSNKTCSYIILWCKGTLGRDIYGSEADIWVNQAENYFTMLEEFDGTTPHFQDKVNAINEIE